MKRIALLLVVAMGALTAQATKYCQMSNAMEAAEKRIGLLERKCKVTQKLLQKSERIGGRLYYFGETDKTWEDARTECKSMGGDLVAKGIRDTQTFNKLFSLAREKGRDFWIGLNDIKVEGRYEFVDGIIGSKSDSYWESRQPDNGAGIEDCMHFWTHRNAKVNDVACGYTIPPLCEFDFA